MFIGNIRVVGVIGPLSLTFRGLRTSKPSAECASGSPGYVSH